MSKPTGVGPDWRKLTGTTRSDWSTLGTLDEAGRSEPGTAADVVIR
jgi:hypothetical protein